MHSRSSTTTVVASPSACGANSDCCAPIPTHSTVAPATSFNSSLPPNAVLGGRARAARLRRPAPGELRPYKGDNRLAYFDLNDFDEAALAPFTLELLRFVTSIHVAASRLRVSTRQAEALGSVFLDCYRKWILDGKARWLERSTAEGMVRDLLRGVIKRTRRQLLKARTVRAGARRRLRLNNRVLPIAKEDRRRLASFIERFGAARGEPRFYRLLDAARRVTGTASLGLERYGCWWKARDRRPATICSI